MAYIRKYGELPGMFVPDVGEVVLASRSAAGPFVRAVVLSTYRRPWGMVRINFQWLEDSRPTAFSDGYRAGKKGHVLMSTDSAAPSLIRRLPLTRTAQDPPRPMGS